MFRVIEAMRLAQIGEREMNGFDTSIATADYREWNDAVVTVYLIPRRMTRRGQRITVARWYDDHGHTVDGARFAYSPEQMLQLAGRHARFSNITQRA